MRHLTHNKDATSVAASVPGCPISNPNVAVRVLPGVLIQVIVSFGDSRLIGASESRETGVTRHRLAQVVRLLDLAPRVQEAILSGENDISERRLRGVAREAQWDDFGARRGRFTSNKGDVVDECPATDSLIYAETARLRCDERSHEERNRQI